METNGSLPTSCAALPVAVDAMGGDAGLDVQVEGALAAFREYGVRSVLVGPKDRLLAKLDSLGATNHPISIHDAQETIEMDESPTRAVVRKPNSSLCQAYRIVEAGRASSIISSGNSGAMMAAGIMICGTLPGIKRPAIATLMPVAGDSKPNVILDSGANVDCHAHNLIQFAIMGAIYYSSLFGVDKPPVALLSNGTEATKGTDIMRAAAMVLTQLESLNYVGYVEGRDVAKDKAKVIVCDGFVGNIVLKSMEGAVRLVFDQILHEGKKGIFRKIVLGLSRGTYRDVFLDRFDYTTYGGAPLLGLRKVAIVLHGSSDCRAVKNGIRVADTFAREKMNGKIAAELVQLEEAAGEPFDNIFGGVLSDSSSLSSRSSKEELVPSREGEDLSLESHTKSNVTEDDEEESKPSVG